MITRLLARLALAAQLARARLREFLGVDAPTTDAQERARRDARVAPRSGFPTPPPVPEDATPARRRRPPPVPPQGQDQALRRPPPRNGHGIEDDDTLRLPAQPRDRRRR